MINIKVEKNIVDGVIKGDLRELTAETAIIINSIYKKIDNEDPQASAIFAKAISDNIDAILFEEATDER